jgi:hypothetical protein
MLGAAAWWSDLLDAGDAESLIAMPDHVPTPFIAYAARSQYIGLSEPWITCSKVFSLQPYHSIHGMRPIREDDAISSVIFTMFVLCVHADSTTSILFRDNEDWMSDANPNAHIVKSYLWIHQLLQQPQSISGFIASLTDVLLCWSMSPRKE